MCGIAGYFGLEKIPPERIENCLNLMNRRGPDNAAHKKWINSSGRNVYLLHTRLSIIDLDPRANQPYNIGDKWIILNGELYNYLERREELTDKGINFFTNSDTEVLLSSIEHFGWDVLNRCEGMWAFAVYNETEGSLTLCRDRFGEKPLYIYQDKTGFYFGSEVKFIMALLNKKLKPNQNHLLRYLVNGYKAIYKYEDTFFEGLTELKPANLLHISSDGEENKSRYWELKYCPEEEMSYQQAVEGVQERLIKAVEIRLRADVPLAFCMSGGVDSNSLISIAKNNFDYDVHGFTIVNTDERYEEQDMVEYAVENLNIRHTSVQVNTSDFLEKLRILVRQHDAPVYTITYYAHWLLMESIAEHGYRISVSGTGADELFTGYYDHHLMYLNEVKNDPELYSIAKEAWTEHIKPIVRNPYLSNPELFIQNPDFRDHIFLDADEFRKSLLVDWSENFTETKYCDSVLRNRMMNELFNESVPVILHEDDLNAMFFSIENRSPFMDRHLAEFCYKIPSRYLIREGAAKAILRDAMSGIVPDKIIENRRKVGFNAPVFSFLDVHDPNVRKQLLEESPVYDYIRREKIEELINKPFLGNSESKFLFYFINCKIFMEEFAE
ncbi:MAG: asparagine synthase (glutamine-hydrolyzing) [Methanomicrobiaceae archaeon]|nr:asparagine synthase (glutamine-hydrolyzing) [Methanomicrobiaceae archaeon]